jgi:hypothetical protein
VLTINFIGNDPIETPYLFNWYLDSSNPERFDVKRLDLFKPNKDVFNYNLHNYFANVSTNEPGLSGYIEGSQARWRETAETRLISYDAFNGSILDLTSEEIAQGFNSSLSGRSINPTHTIDANTYTTRLGTGGSANSVSLATDDSAVSAAPYSHNAAYLLLNTALSGVGHDITVCFDVAIYTNTSPNSAYAQINTTHYNG